MYNHIKIESGGMAQRYLYSSKRIRKTQIGHLNMVFTHTAVYNLIFSHIYQVQKTAENPVAFDFDTVHVLKIYRNQAN